MDVFFIFVVLLESCLSCRYDDGTYCGLNKQSGTPQFGRPPFSRSPFGRPPFSRPPFGRPPFSRPPFRRPPYSRPPFDRTPNSRPQFGRRFRDRSQRRMYGEKYYRNRPVDSASAWLRQNDEPKKRKSVVVTVQPKHPNSSLSVFRPLLNEQHNATLVDEHKYKWIARVAASFLNPAGTALACNAACIEERIFLTTAHCLYTSKVFYSRVVYQNEILEPIAFVVPSNQTRQMFNDLGLVVVKANFSKPWHTIGISKMFTWADDEFVWHTRHGWYHGVAVGYIESFVDFRPDTLNQSTYAVYELEVHISNYLCNYLYNAQSDNRKDAFFVPCYSTCNLVEHYENNPKCYNYLAGEGHIVISKEKTRGILGVATWTGRYKSGLSNPPLPIGMAVPYSPNFKKDLDCARKIKAAPDTTVNFNILCR